MKWNDESRRKLEERAERSLGMVAPQIRDLDSGSAVGVEVGPSQVAGRDEDGLAWRCTRSLGLRLSGCCASTGDARRSEIENTRTLLGLIEIPLVSGSLYGVQFHRPYEDLGAFRLDLDPPGRVR